MTTSDTYGEAEPDFTATSAGPADPSDGGAGDTARNGGSSPPSPDQIVLLTYRFLRLGILAAVVTLTVSLVAEIMRTDCLRNSISAYFYSPSRTIFTGSLMAVGLCLIAIQGDDDWDEASLNLAGMLAPMIAVLPTSVSTKCDPAFVGLPDNDPRYQVMIEAIEDQTRDGLHNNVIAYFGVLLAALIAVAFLVPKRLVRSDLGAGKVRIALVLYIAVVGVFVYFASRTWNEHSAWAHNLSAISMFVFFGFVVCYNATRSKAPAWYRVACLVIAVLMAVMALAVFPVLRWVLDVDWNVFFLEATEIALFGAFWMLQTIAFVDRDPITAEKIAEPAAA
jgi:hypothetical protein